MTAASSRAVAALLVAASCGDGGGAGPIDAPVAVADAAGTTFDAASPDAALNPARLWLAPINGSEINLQLLDHEPPPF